MKLLARKEASVETQKQKKALIDEGFNLAGKVDALRETKVKEEGNLERFRSETLKVAQSEIDQAIRQRDYIRDEIKELEKERELLQIPLDSEWEKIKAAYLKYSDQVGNLESAKETVAQQIGENTMLAHELEVEKGKIQEMRRITEENLFHADDDLTRAREESAKMRNMAQAILSSVELRELVIRQREDEYQATVETTNKEKSRLELWETDLSNREKRLIDRYATLERTIKRIKK